ncbi:MAG: hypothetical protein BJ554DRAFT_713 [Olpidium bornovanus]|uniref:Uncharacterized protein n=1 Tax=Olpidium bornovanus TaxID=278681 RepID=A0A8H7ZTH0_9FUNG|nr:MAG: hypothetical protein BJ554DRAFT_713 [Olpidium bornovanus]
MVDFGDRDRLSDFHLRHADHAGRGAGSADAAPARSAAASHRPFVAPGGGSGSAVVVPPALPARAPVRGLPAALPPAVPPAPSSGGGGGGGGGGSSTSSASTSASASSSGSRVTAVTSTAVPAPPSGVPAATLSRQQTDGAPRGHSVDANRPDGIVVRSTIATPRDGSRRRIDAAAATAAAASAPSAVVAANRQERIGSTDRTEEIPDEPVPTETKKEKKRREAIERLNKLSEEFLKQKERLYHDQLEFLEREMKELQEGERSPHFGRVTVAPALAKSGSSLDSFLFPGP